MTIKKDICSVCEEVHDVELLKVGGDHGVLYKVWKCVSTNETWESIQTPKNLDEWAEMYLHCESEACGNVWCEDCTRVWDELMHGKRAVEHHAHADGACPHANTINPKGRVFCPDCNSLVPAPQVA